MYIVHYILSRKEIILKTITLIVCTLTLFNIVKTIGLNIMLSKISRVYIDSLLQKFTYGHNLVISD